MAQCWADVDPSSTTLAQHLPDIGPTPRVCWAVRQILRQSTPNTQETGELHVGTASQTVAQHEVSIGSTSLVCRAFRIYPGPVNQTNLTWFSHILLRRIDLSCSIFGVFIDTRYLRRNYSSISHSGIPAHTLKRRESVQSMKNIHFGLYKVNNTKPAVWVSTLGYYT